MRLCRIPAEGGAQYPDHDDSDGVRHTSATQNGGSHETGADYPGPVIVNGIPAVILFQEGILGFPVHPFIMAEQSGRCDRGDWKLSGRASGDRP